MAILICRRLRAQTLVTSNGTVEGCDVWPRQQVNIRGMAPQNRCAIAPRTIILQLTS